MVARRLLICWVASTWLQLVCMISWDSSNMLTYVGLRAYTMIMTPLIPRLIDIALMFDLRVVPCLRKAGGLWKAPKSTSKYASTTHCRRRKSSNCAPIETRAVATMEESIAPRSNAKHRLCVNLAEHVTAID